ncbi:unnamed protein product [Brassicogethes aeneus]|uniref:Uncharacterized protein n=1 Tax=Brassicogethes aeneus TaxID=1431903 RepID=A0A9P0B077_BRAAE|nr:unnamed protein product [Brassicogethes aeneus]
MHKKSRKQDLFRDGTKSNKSGELPNKLPTTVIDEPIYDFQKEMEKMERSKKNIQNEKEKHKREKSFLEKGLLKLNRNEEERPLSKDRIKNEKNSIEKSYRRPHLMSLDLEDRKKHRKIEKNEINHIKKEPVKPTNDETLTKKEQRKQKSKYTRTFSLSPEMKEKSKRKMEKEDLLKKSELPEDTDKRMLKPKRYKIPIESNNYELVNKNTEDRKQVKKVSKQRRERHHNNIEVNSPHRFKIQSVNPEVKGSVSEDFQIKKVILEHKNERKTRRVKKELNEEISNNLTNKEMEVLQLMDIRDNFSECESTNLLIEHAEKKSKKQKTELDIKSMLITKMQKKLDFFLNKNQTKSEAPSKEPTEIIKNSSEASDLDLHKKLKSSKTKKQNIKENVPKHKERVKLKLDKNIDTDSEKSKPSRTKIQKRRKKHRRQKEDKHLKESREVVFTPPDPVQMFYFTIPKSNTKDEEKEKSGIECNKLDKAEKLLVPEGEVEKHKKKKKHVQIDVPSCVKEDPNPLLTCPDVFHHNLDLKDPRSIHLVRRIQRQRKKRMERTHLITPILSQEKKTCKENDVDEVKKSMNCLTEGNITKDTIQPSTSPTPKISKFKTNVECRNVSIMAFPPTLVSKKSLRDHTQEWDPIEKKMESALFKNYYEYRDTSGQVKSDRIVVASDSNRIQVDFSDPLDICDIESSSNKHLYEDEIKVVVNNSSPLDLASEAKINTIFQELVGELLTKDSSCKTNIKDIKRQVTTNTKDKKVYKYELTTYREYEPHDDFTINYFSNTKFVEGSYSGTDNEKVINVINQSKSRSLSPKINKHTNAIVPPKTVFRTKSPKCSTKNQPKICHENVTNKKTTKPPPPPTCLRNENPSLNNMLKRSKSDVDILEKKEETSNLLHSKSSGSLKQDEKQSSQSSANDSEKKAEKSKAAPDLKPEKNRNVSNSSRKSEKSPAVKNQKPKVDSKVVQKNKPTLNRSKSELNPREANKAKDESQINSLIELDKFHKAKPNARNRSLAGSLDRSLEKNASRMNSSMFLTKQYTGTKMSAFQKRKCYDESIRRRLRKNPSKKSEPVPQQIFEVRFVTVMGNDTQGTNATTGNVIVNKVVPVTDGSNCNFVICCPNIVPNEKEKVKNSVQTEVNLNNGQKEKPKHTEVNVSNSQKEKPKNSVQTEINLTNWQKEKDPSPLKACTEVVLVKDKKCVEMKSTGTDPSPFLFRPKATAKKFKPRPTGIPSGKRQQKIAYSREAKFLQTDEKTLQSISVNTSPVTAESEKVQTVQQEHSVITTNTNPIPHVNTSTSPLCLTDSKDSETQPSVSEIPVGKTADTENEEIIKKFMQVLSQNKGSTSELEESISDKDKRDEVKSVIEYLCQAHYSKSQSEHVTPPVKKRKIFDETTEGSFTSIASSSVNKNEPKQIFANSKDSKITKKNSKGLPFSKEEFLNLMRSDLPITLFGTQVSCPILNSPTSSFEFLYENSEESGNSTDVEKTIRVTTLDVLPLSSQNVLPHDVLEKYFENTLNNEVFRSPLSEESGYASSKKCNSVTNFFKKSSILALFKPASSEKSKESNDKLVVNNLKEESFNKMRMECQMYARKVMENKSSETVISYEEIPLGVLLGKSSQECRPNANVYTIGFDNNTSFVDTVPSKTRIRFLTKKKNIPKIQRNTKNIKAKVSKVEKPVIIKCSSPSLLPLENITTQTSPCSLLPTTEQTTTPVKSEESNYPTSNSSMLSVCRIFRNESDNFDILSENSQKENIDILDIITEVSNEKSMHSSSENSALSVKKLPSNASHDKTEHVSSKNIRDLASSEVTINKIEHVSLEIIKNSASNEVSSKQSEPLSLEDSTLSVKNSEQLIEVTDIDQESSLQCIKVGYSFGSIIDKEVIENFVSKTDHSKDQLQRQKSSLTDQVYSGCFSNQNLTELCVMNTVRSQICNTFFENMFKIYEKEIEIREQLYVDGKFFEDLKSLAMRTDEMMGRQKLKTKSSVFGKLFKRKSKDEKSLHSADSSLSVDDKCKSLDAIKNDSQDVKLMCEANNGHVKTMARDAKRRFSSLVQAVSAQKDMNHELKFLRFLKILERVEQGDFSVIRKDGSKLTEVIKEEIKGTFLYGFQLAFLESKKSGRQLSDQDLNQLKLLVIKYSYGLLFDAQFIATYIGKGVITSESQLKDAVRYLLNTEKNKTIDTIDFEKTCLMKL